MKTLTRELGPAPRMQLFLGILSLVREISVGLAQTRSGLGHDLEKSLGGTLIEHLQECKALSIGTAQEGASLDVTYQTRLRPDGSASELVYALNRIEGVQKVKLERRGSDQS